MSKTVKPYFPLFMDLSEKKVYVVGAGTIAKRRIRALCGFTNHLVVIAPEVNPELSKMELEGQLVIKRKQYEPADIQEADIVIAATSDNKINREIYRVCRERDILVNVCSDKGKCDFYFPGLAMKGNVVVGVTANGTNHKKAKTVVEKIREMLEECW